MTQNLPQNFIVEFKSIDDKFVKVFLNGNQVGDTLTDNSYVTDYYRYHDVFHFSFSTILNWSPCIRFLTKCKRKSNPKIDEVEDGARARSIEEGISAMVFEDALKNDFYIHSQIDDNKIEFIMSTVSRLEVGNKTKADWIEAINKSYFAFRYLVKNRGGKIHFNTETKEINPLMNSLN